MRLSLVAVLGLVTLAIARGIDLSDLYDRCIPISAITYAAENTPHTSNVYHVVNTFSTNHCIAYGSFPDVSTSYEVFCFYEQRGQPSAKLAHDVAAHMESNGVVDGRQCMPNTTMYVVKNHTGGCPAKCADFFDPIDIVPTRAARAISLSADRLESTLNAHYVVAAIMNVDAGFRRFNGDIHSATYKVTGPATEPASVVIVGYTEDAWLVRNAYVAGGQFNDSNTRDNQTSSVMRIARTPGLFVDGSLVTVVPTEKIQ